MNSKELYVSAGGERTLLRNGEGSGYVLGGGEEAVAVEADESGAIHLLSWDEARKGFNLQLFGADGELSGGAIELSGGDKATYEAEFLFNLDLNGDGVRGQNIQSVDEGEYHREGDLDVFKGGNELGL